LGGGLRKGGVVVDNNLQLPLMRTQVPVNLAANHPHLPPTSCGCRLSVSFGMLSVLVSGGLDPGTSSNRRSSGFRMQIAGTLVQQQLQRDLNCFGGCLWVFMAFMALFVWYVPVSCG